MGEFQRVFQQTARIGSEFLDAYPKELQKNFDAQRRADREAQENQAWEEHDAAAGPWTESADDVSTESESWESFV